jgi:hypothetical protein
MQQGVRTCLLDEEPAMIFRNISGENKRRDSESCIFVISEFRKTTGRSRFHSCIVSAEKEDRRSAPKPMEKTAETHLYRILFIRIKGSQNHHTDSTFSTGLERI